MIIGLDSHNARKRKKSRKSKSRKARRYETRPAYLIRAEFNEKMGAEVLKPGATLADMGTLRTHMDVIMEGSTRAAREIADRIEARYRTAWRSAARSGRRSRSKWSTMPLANFSTEPLANDSGPGHFHCGPVCDPTP